MREALDNYREICCEQPQPVRPPTFDFESSRPASRSSRPSQWLAEGRTFASRASSRASDVTRRTRRSTIGSIGAPYDFKKAEPPRERGFRPLTLSIHIPGNELPPLPQFNGAFCDDDAGLTFPAPVLTKSRSESMLSRPSSAFTIPRKPVPSRTVSMDVSRASMESRYDSHQLGQTAHLIHRSPSVAASQSTQDFLDALDDRLPNFPPLLRSKTGPGPAYTLYRRASEQSLRLRTHLEERSQMEHKFLDCDTILEDKEEKSPIATDPASAGLPGECKPAHKLNQPRSIEWFRTPFSPPSQPSRAAPSPPSPSPAVSARTRISQWLRSSPLASPTDQPETSPAPTPLYYLRPSSVHKRISISSSSIYSSSTAAETTAWTTPRSSPHRKGSSLSSCLTSVQAAGGGIGEGVFMVEKDRDMEVSVRDVKFGVAF